PTELVVHRRPASVEVRFDALAAADIFDDHLCVWKHGADEPILRIPIGSANTHVLLRLLHERITPRTGGGEAHPQESLGRVLFERKPERGIGGGVYLAPVNVVLGFSAAAVCAVVLGARDAWWVAAAVSLGIALVWILAATRSASFRVHENGVVRKGLFGAEHLKYSEVDTFTY